MSNEIGSALRDRLMEEVERLRAELADCRMQLDASCNAEELRQVRAERDALLEALKHQRMAFGTLLDRQCRAGTVTVSEADVRQGLRQIEAAIDAARRKP